MNIRISEKKIQRCSLLALDISTHMCSVSVSKNNKILSVSTRRIAKHEKITLTLITNLLTQLSIVINKLKGIFFNQGPVGHSTGLRINKSMTDGLATGLRLRNVGITNTATFSAKILRAFRAHGLQTYIKCQPKEILYNLCNKHPLFNISQLSKTAQSMLHKIQAQLKRKIQFTICKQNVVKDPKNSTFLKLVYNHGVCKVQSCSYDIISVALSKYTKSN